MTRLLRAELARAAARPFVWFVALGLLTAVVGLLATAWWDTRPPSAAERAAAQVELDDAMRTWRVEGAARVAECREHEAELRAQFPDESIEGYCEHLAPTLERYLPLRPDISEILGGRLTSAGATLVLGMLVVGVGLVTAEFASGAIGTWLTFAPRRGRVFGSKLAAATLVALPLGAATLVLLGIGVRAVYAVNGLPGWMPPDLWAVLGWQAARWLVAGLGATALGVGLAFALRHAAAVTGVLVWWFAAVETALPLVLPQAQWLPVSTNVQAWVSGVAQYAVPACVPDPRAAGGELCEDVLHTVGMAQGSLVAGALVVLALVLGWVAFRVRDVG